MILEAAFLKVKSGSEQEFEEAIKQAAPFISATPGYVAHEIHKCIEVEGKYLLLVKWNKLEDHTVGFRNSPKYQEWKRLLHHFYEPFPTVEHFEPIEMN